MRIISIPEILEIEVGESIGARTSSLVTFKELGPPDLVHLSKSHPKTNLRENGTYHFVTGVDTSSSASVAAYLNTLTFSLGETQLWFGKHPQWKVHSGTYCTYNAFSRVDLRVSAQIPGSVEAYAVDDRGDKRNATDALWMETYLSGALRALLYSDDEAYYVTACRRLDPFTGRGAEDQFLEAFEKLFFQGPNLGSVSEVQVPTLSHNLLVDGFFKFVEVTGLYERAIAIVERISQSRTAEAYDARREIQTIIAKLRLLGNQEVRAIDLMCSIVAEDSRESNALELQAQFCQKKGRLDLALDCAIRAVNASPSEFNPWARLAQVYIAQEDYERALLTLNSCPMFTYHDIDQHRMPPSSKVHLPLPTDGVLDEVWAVESQSIAEQQSEVNDQDLLKLPAPTLRSTFAKAYELLTKIVSNIGWDALLKYRSNVFVMEEEYRKDKRDTQGVQPPEPATTDNQENEVNGNGTHGPQESISSQASVQAVAAPGTSRDNIKNKRLCERWLDNLFMVLYEDLRVYTVWRAEHVHYQSQQLEYKKSALEWEILGMVALRLHHKEEAAEAFLESLKVRFSHRVLWKLLDFYLEKGLQHNKSNSAATQATVETIVKLVAWNHRWYCEYSPKLYHALRTIVASEGLVKVKSSVEAVYNRQGVLELMEDMFQQLQRFNAEGYEN
uniref:ARAD1B09350p n=1 Tax=Blastobotrys adeninivorans TaxID=409370 RepID=A0A060T5A7_BLAAD